MDSSELISIIERENRPLVESFYSELRTNLGTSHYHRLSNEELFRRGHAVYHHLADWLNQQQQDAVRAAGEDLGQRRFAEGIPLGQVVLALILHEDHLWEFASLHGLQADENLRRLVAGFFSAFVYSTAHGYKRSLAESNRRSQRAVAAPEKPALGGRSGDSKVLEVSRGGQVGEQGG